MKYQIIDNYRVRCFPLAKQCTLLEAIDKVELLQERHEILEINKASMEGAPYQQSIVFELWVYFDDDISCGIPADLAREYFTMNGYLT